jgi:hypothetical protein
MNRKEKIVHVWRFFPLETQDHREHIGLPDYWITESTQI